MPSFEQCHSLTGGGGGGAVGPTIINPGGECGHECDKHLIEKIVKKILGEQGGGIPFGASLAIEFSSAFLNQKADTPLTALFTPSVNGLWMLNLIAVTTTVDAGAGTPTWSLNYQPITGGPASTSASLDLTTLGAPVGVSNSVIALLANSPVTFSLIGGAPYGNASYDLFASAVKLA